MTIKKKLIIIIESLVVVGASISLLVYYISASYFIEKAVNNHIESVAVLKENRILGLINENKIDIEHWSEESNLLKVILSDKQNQNYPQTYSFLKDKLVSEDSINNLFIVNTNGRIIVSTNKEDEGKFVSFEPYFINGQNNSYVQGFYLDTILSAPGITISSPIKNNENNLIGVLVGRLDLQVFSDILNERSGLGFSGETYLINNINLLVTDTLFFKGGKFEKFFYSEGMDHCLSGHSGIHTENYVGQSVFGTHKFLPEIDACLIVDISSAEAYKQINYLKIISFFIVLLLSLFSVPIITVVSNSISGPIKKIKENAERIKMGEVGLAMDIKTGDELEDLAKSLNNMNKTLEESHADLENKVKERTAVIDSKMKELESMNKMMIGRELKMIELKKEIAELKEKLNNIHS